MEIFALIFFFWNADGTVDLSIHRVEDCQPTYEVPENVTYMCVKFTVPKPGEPV
jgi:hypothetical protein